MALSDLTATERHRRVAGDFTDHVQRVADWDVPTPVDGWTARDVVDHLVTWLPSFLSAGAVELPARPAVDDGPVAAWTSHTDAVQALLDDPQRGAAQFTHEYVGNMPVTEAIDRFYTADVFMHTWDLALAEDPLRRRTAITAHPFFVRNGSPRNGDRGTRAPEHRHASQRSEITVQH